VIFKGLEIKQSYEKTINGSYENMWVGKFQVDSTDGSMIWLKVTPELCERLIAVCADHIVEVAEEAATTMKASILEQLTPLRVTHAKESQQP
jgi:hypothetical protein